MSLRHVQKSRESVRRVRRGAVRRACESAAPPIGPESRWEALEHRRLLTIVQPVGQTYLSFEAEHPEAVFTDLDADGYQWAVATGSQVLGNTTLPSGGAALFAQRDAAVADNNEGQVTYPIQLTTAGPYLFYARTKYTASGGDNSMYL